MGLDIKCFPFGMYGENTYIVKDNATGCMAVIDPGYFGQVIRNEIADDSSLKFILLTHGHHDHYLAAAQYMEEYPDAVFAAPEAEKFLLGKSECPEPHIWLKEGDVIDLGETRFRVIATPGHTEGGICFNTGREIFTGDTLFRLSVGRTDLETGSWETLTSSISEKLYTLDDDLTVYPGHGADTTIGYEKKANPFV